MEPSTLVVRRLKVKATGGWRYICMFGGSIRLDPLGLRTSMF